MNVEIRVYKRYDTDLLALHDTGYSLTRMMTDALVSYANGSPFMIFIDEITDFDLNHKKNIRLRLNIDNSDYASVSLIESIKHGYRSNFCKMVLRNAIVQQNLTCYFSDLSFSTLHTQNAASINSAAFQNLVMGSDYRTMRQDRVIMGQNVTYQQQPGRPIAMNNRQIPVGNRGYQQQYQQQAPVRQMRSPRAPLNTAPVAPAQQYQQQYQAPATEAVQQLQPAAPQAPAQPVQPVQPSAPVQPTSPVPEQTAPAQVNVPVTESDTGSGNESVVPGLAGDDNLMKMFENI